MLRSLGLGILLLSVGLVLSVDKYKKLGDEAVLSPGSVSDPIISIIWIHGSNIAVEWYTTETVVHRDFRDRCKLDFNTGALTISNLTVKDSGIYTAEINNKVMRPTEITVISAVPKPMVSTQCRSEGTRCTFTCEGSITGAEPVTYSWVIGARQIPQSSSNQLSITKDDAEIVGKPIRCQVKNPVSSARSDDVIIPFTNIDTDKYKKLGGEAVLSPSSVSDRITSITWKHGPDIAVEWYGQETVSYREFRGRCKLDFSTGALTISNLTLKDSGNYTAEINNKVMSPTTITVISAVPKPMVSTQCNSEGTRCTFTCEASITGAEPVTYSWMVDGKNIAESSKSLEKEKDDPEMVGKPIRCQLENPVSSERSYVIIPFTNGDYMDAIVGGVVAFVFLIVVACGVVFICYRYRRRSQNLNEDMSSAVKLFNTDMKTRGTASTVMVDQAAAWTVPETQKKMLTSTNPASVWIRQLKGKRRDLIIKQSTK